ncbi:MAG: ferrochelatase [Bacteroidota bacterium]
MTSQKPVAVILLQLGGPDSLESVEPFLYNLFCDPDIIDLPLAFLFRKPLARFVASRRSPRVREYYKEIGGRSPILKLTRRQAVALEDRLRGTIDARVFVAMRYWHPLTEEAVDQIERGDFRRLVLLPLYPHYSKTTTGSSINEWNRVVRGRLPEDLEVDVVLDYSDHPEYIRSLVRNISIALNRVPREERGRVVLVFSAHGTPVKLVHAGDPYQESILRTYRAVLAAGDFNLPHRLCYQSKVGPERWLEPSLDGTIRELAAEGVSHVITVPIAFVSDHSETLWEINIETKRMARELGITHFDMSPALNTNASFVEALADLVLERVAR